MRALVWLSLGVIVGSWAKTGGEVLGLLIHNRSILPN